MHQATHAHKETKCKKIFQYPLWSFQTMAIFQMTIFERKVTIFKGFSKTCAIFFEKAIKIAFQRPPLRADTEEVSVLTQKLQSGLM